MHAAFYAAMFEYETFFFLGFLITTYFQVLFFFFFFFFIIEFVRTQRETGK